MTVGNGVGAGEASAVEPHVSARPTVKRKRMMWLRRWWCNVVGHKYRLVDPNVMHYECSRCTGGYLVYFTPIEKAEP
jgi:hypothetical protein